MPRYVIERTFPDGLNFPTGAQGRKTAAKYYVKPDAVSLTEVDCR